jgi:hypothetical protein
VSPEQALRTAIEKAGGQAALAHALGITRQRVHAWEIAPLKHVHRIAELTGMRRHVLRPDLFAKTKSADLGRFWRAVHELVDAIEELPPGALGLTEESRKRYLNGISPPGLQPPQ